MPVVSDYPIKTKSLKSFDLRLSFLKVAPTGLKSNHFFEDLKKLASVLIE